MDRISISKITVEDMITKMALDDCISIDLTWGEEQSREYGNGFECEYYTEISEEHALLLDFISGNQNFNGVCPKCKERTMFTMGPGKDLQKKDKNRILRSYCDSMIDSDYYIPEVEEALNDRIQELTSFSTARYFDKHYCCTKCNEIYRASFKLQKEKDGNTLLVKKVGQDPDVFLHTYVCSRENEVFLKDIKALEDYRRMYERFINNDYVSSLLYMRRIIEKYIFYVFNINKSGLSITEEEFGKKKTSEKIDAIKCYLPEVFSKNTCVYGIVSKGIHQLESDECKNWYYDLEKLINRIVDFEVNKKEDKKLTSALQKIARSI